MGKQVATKKKLYQSVSALIKQAQQKIVRNVNTTMIITYFHIGRMIVEEEQKGQSRATYAKETITNLSNQLTQEFGKGYSTSKPGIFPQVFHVIQRANFPISDWEISTNKKIPITDWGI